MCTCSDHEIQTVISSTRSAKIIALAHLQYITGQLILNVKAALTNLISNKEYQDLKAQWDDIYGADCWHNHIVLNIIALMTRFTYLNTTSEIFKQLVSGEPKMCGVNYLNTGVTWAWQQGPVQSAVILRYVSAGYRSKERKKARRLRHEV